MFDRVKSKAIHKGLNMLLNGRYGEVQELDLDTQRHCVSLKILLKGEPSPVDVSIGRYEIDVRDPNRPVVVFHDLKASRQWIQELASDNFEGKSVDIPQKFVPLLKMLL